MRTGETPGRDYSFVSQSEFDQLIKAGVMHEYGKHKGHYYGTVTPPDEDMAAQRVLRTKTFKVGSFGG